LGFFWRKSTLSEVQLGGLKGWCVGRGHPVGLFASSSTFVERRAPGSPRPGDRVLPTLSAEIVVGTLLDAGAAGLLLLGAGVGGPMLVLSPRNGPVTPDGRSLAGQSGETAIGKPLVRLVVPVKWQVLQFPLLHKEKKRKDIPEDDRRSIKVAPAILPYLPCAPGVAEKLGLRHGRSFVTICIRSFRPSPILHYLLAHKAVRVPAVTRSRSSITPRAASAGSIRGIILPRATDDWGSPVLWRHHPLLILQLFPKLLCRSPPNSLGLLSHERQDQQRGRVVLGHPVVALLAVAPIGECEIVFAPAQSRSHCEALCGRTEATARILG